MREFLTLCFFGCASAFAGAAITYSFQEERVQFRDYPVILRIQPLPPIHERNELPVYDRRYA